MSISLGCYMFYFTYRSWTFSYLKRYLFFSHLLDPFNMALTAWRIIHFRHKTQFKSHESSFWVIYKGIRRPTFSPLPVAPSGIFTTVERCSYTTWEMAPATINWNHDGQRRLSLSRVRLPTLPLLLPVLLLPRVSLLYRMPLLPGDVQ